MRVAINRKIILLALLAVLAVLLANRVLPSITMNGIDLDDVRVEQDLIQHGGPPRDGIPSIDEPDFIDANEASFLEDGDRVLGVQYRGQARAYPVRILDYHEIVNDTFDDEAIVITYCPLCGTGMAFKPEPPVKEFGVSGLLYNSDVLLYDRETESLWSQIMGESISGPMAGKKLVRLPLSHTSWRDWRKRYPSTTVLSTSTGYKRDYTKSPYAGYADNGQVWFPVASRDDRFPPKEWVLGVTVNGKHRAYPFSVLADTDGVIEDTLGGARIAIRYDQDNRTAYVLDEQGAEIPTLMAFWFAWSAFYPETDVYARD